MQISKHGDKTAIKVSDPTTKCKRHSVFELSVQGSASHQHMQRGWNRMLASHRTLNLVMLMIE